MGSSHKERADLNVSTNSESVTASEISGTTDRLYGFATWCVGVGETKTTQKTDRDCDFPGTVGNRNEALPR